MTQQVQQVIVEVLFCKISHIFIYDKTMKLCEMNIEVKEISKSKAFYEIPTWCQ